jgi:hypothetical protein
LQLFVETAHTCEVISFLSSSASLVDMGFLIVCHQTGYDLFSFFIFLYQKIYFIYLLFQDTGSGLLPYETEFSRSFLFTVYNFNNICIECAIPT